jgi:hypothetical protein
VLHSLFDRAEHSWWGALIRDSTWGFAIIEILHLFGLVLLLGGVFVMSLRLLGLIMTDRPVSRVADDLSPWTLVGLATMLATGLSLWASEALRMYDSPPFWFKMSFLLAALVFHFTVYRAVSRRDEVQPVVRGLAGGVGLLLWFGVGFCGRIIGFF